MNSIPAYRKGEKKELSVYAWWRGGVLNAPFIELSKYNGTGACPRLLFPVTAGTISAQASTSEGFLLQNTLHVLSGTSGAEKPEAQVMPITNILVPCILQHHTLRWDQLSRVTDVQSRLS